MLNQQELTVIDYLLAQNLDLLCVFSQDFTVINANSSFIDNLKLDAKNIIGKSLSTLLLKDNTNLNSFLKTANSLGNESESYISNIPDKEGNINTVCWQIIKLQNTQILKGTILTSTISNSTFKDANFINISNSISDCFLILDKNFNLIFKNKAAELKFSHPLFKENTNCFFASFPEETNTRFLTNLKQIIHFKETLRFVEFSAILNTWFSIVVMAIDDEFIIISTDISDKIVEYKTNDLELKTFEMNISKERSTEDILLFLLIGFENLYPQLHTSILKIEDSKIRHFCSPNLPKHYCEFIDGQVIGANIGSCGSAAFLKKTVITENLQTDPNWTKFNHLLVAENYKSCWSFPIISNKDIAVMATFAVYAKEERKPTEAEIKSIARICNIVKIIFEDIKHDHELLQINNRYKTATMATNDAIYDWDLKLKKVYWSENIYNIFGFAVKEVDKIKNWWKNSIHPNDLEDTIKRLKACLTEKKSGWTAEYRLKCKNGTYKHVYDRAYIMYDAKNEPITVIGAIQDISILKEREIEIIKQNNKLKEIAQISSHDLRRPVTSVLGLISLFNVDNLADDNNKLVINYLQKASKELDDVIHTIVSKTLEADNTIYDKHVKLRE